MISSTKASVVFTLLFSFCFNASAQVDFGTVIDEVSDVFNLRKDITNNDLTGTWCYQGPALSFASGHLFADVGGNLSSARLESEIQSVLNAHGIRKGSVVFDVFRNGKFIQKFKRYEFDGTYKLNDRNISLTYAGGYNPVVGKITIDDDVLTIMMDVATLDKYVRAMIGRSCSSQLRTTIANLKRIRGLKVGMQFKKK